MENRMETITMGYIGDILYLTWEGMSVGVALSVATFGSLSFQAAGCNKCYARAALLKAKLQSPVCAWGPDMHPTILQSLLHEPSETPSFFKGYHVAHDAEGNWPTWNN